MNPQNGIVGDSDYGTKLPEVSIDREVLLEEARMAKFSKTKEFKKLKDYAESRIAFYQQQLPDGRPVASSNDVTVEDWRVANSVIGEFKALLNEYEMAAEGLERVQRKDS